MASKARSGKVGDWRRDLLLRPAPNGAVATASVAIVVVGAIYCSGYEALTTGLDNWPASLIWAAYSLLPFYLLFELVKRREWRSGSSFCAVKIAGLFVAVTLASLVAERIDFAVGGSAAPPVLLSLLRRLPAIALAGALVALSRYEQRRLPGVRANDNRPEDRFVNPAAMRWIGAADNYLEVHFAGRTDMVRMTMRQAEQRLARAGFVRIHRSIIVNRAVVAHVSTGVRGAEVVLDDGTRLPGGSAFSANLRSLA